MINDNWPTMPDSIPAEIPEQAKADGYAASRIRVSRVIESGEFEELENVLYGEMLSRRMEDLSYLDARTQADKLIGRSRTVLPEAELYDRLQESKDSGIPLKIKYGIDPTGPFVHLGHAVPIILLDRMQRMGHDITIIVGDFTTAIGDPSGRSDSRPVLTEEQISENFATYAEQIGRLVDISKATVVRNSEWLDKVSLKELLSTASRIQLAQLLQRDDFRKRIEAGNGITQTEVLYPIVMGLDSVALQSDIELGGQDQLLNMQMCRTVMEVHGQRPEVVISTGLVLGTTGTGEKMSKSLNNYIALTDKPEDVFGRTMSIPDEMMIDYYKMFTEIEDNELMAVLSKMHPMKAKMLLAKTLTAIISGPEAAADAARAFDARFSKKNFEQVTTGSVDIGLGTSAIIACISEQRKEGSKAVRRLLEGGGIQLFDKEGQKIVVRTIEELDEALQRTEVRFIKAGRSVLLSVQRSESSSE